MGFRLTVGTFNFERGGWNDDNTRLNLDPLIDTISQAVCSALSFRPAPAWRVRPIRRPSPPYDPEITLFCRHRSAFAFKREAA